MVNLKQLKQQLQNLLGKGQLSPIIRELKKLLPEQSARLKALILLEKRQNDANLKRLRGTLSDQQLQLEYNQISADLLLFIDSLEDADFDPSQTASAVAQEGKVRQGSILYKVPDHMTLNEETLCVVRVAFDETQIVRDIDLNEHVKLVQRRVSNIMQAQLYDPSDEKPFRITTPNDAEQFVDEDDYTEWLFMVTPVLPGEHPLWLKIAVIEEVRGKERKREVVLRQKINIATEAAPVSEVLPDFKQVMELSLAFGMERYSEVPPKTSFDIDLMQPKPSPRVPYPSSPSPGSETSAPSPPLEGQFEPASVPTAKNNRGTFLRVATLALVAVVFGSYLLFNLPSQDAQPPTIPAMKEENTEKGEPTSPGRVEESDRPTPTSGDGGYVKPRPPSKTVRLNLVVEPHWANSQLYLDGEPIEILGRQQNLFVVQVETGDRLLELRRADGQTCRLKTTVAQSQTIRMPCE